MPAKRSRKITRRGLLQTSAGLALSGVNAVTLSAEPKSQRPGAYEALGIKPVINATGTVTALGGSLMPPEVIAAWTEAARHFVNMQDLQDKVGQRIAKLLGVEAAMVTTGAAGALMLGAAAILTGGNADYIQRLPDTRGMKNEILMQKTHHTCYDNQLLNVGAKLLDVETSADVKRAAGERTALMFFMNFAEPDGRISRAEWVGLARQHRVPTLLDAAADVPPIERLAEYCQMGFDLVAVSGGKALRGPNNTGLLVGRKDLIEAAKRNTNPNCGTIGRMMKVSKEDMVALWAAVERFIHIDHEAEQREWERRIAVIEQAVKNIPTMQTERLVPPIANHVPHIVLNWDEKRLGLSRAQVIKLLAAGDPPIQLGRVSGTGDRGLFISVFTLQDGEEQAVAERLRSVLRDAAQRKS